MEGLDNTTSLDIPELDSLSSLPDTSDLPSDEKVTHLTQQYGQEEQPSDCL
jgi:hypothetical protein